MLSASASVPRTPYSLFLPVVPCLTDAGQKPVTEEAKQQSPNEPVSSIPFKTGVAGRDETDCDQVIIQPFWQFAHKPLSTLWTFPPFAIALGFESTPAILAVATQGVLDYRVGRHRICDFLHFDRFLLQLFVVLEKAP